MVCISIILGVTNEPLETAAPARPRPKTSMMPTPRYAKEVCGCSSESGTCKTLVENVQGANGSLQKEGVQG